MNHALKKIVVIGPESTGKSTLSAGLAAALNEPWVPEYAREYLDKLTSPYTEADLLHIAHGQIAAEQAKAGIASKILVCDTDLYVLKVWGEHSYGRCHRQILEQIATRRYDYYLLTDIDMPWQPDPQREHGEPHMRRYFYHQYLDIVINSNVPWTVVSGSSEERLQQALQATAHL